MSLVTTTQLNPGLMIRGANAVFLDYKEYQGEFKKIFTVHDTNLATVWDIEMKSTGYASEKQETGPTASDFQAQMFTTVYDTSYYSLQIGFSRKLLRGNQYTSQFPHAARQLRRSMEQTKEVVHAAVINNAVNPQYIGGDGQPLLSTKHPTYTGTYSNMLTGISAGLNQSSLQMALIQNALFTDAAGVRTPSQIKALLVPVQQEYNAAILVKSEFSPQTATSAINPIYRKFPEGVIVNHFLNNPYSWGILNYHDQGFKSFQFDSLEVDGYTENQTDTYFLRAIEAYVPKWTNARCYFGAYSV